MKKHCFDYAAKAGLRLDLSNIKQPQGFRKGLRSPIILSIRILGYLPRIVEHIINAFIFQRFLLLSAPLI